MAARDYVEKATKVCLGFQDPNREVRKLVYQKLIQIFSKTNLTEEDLRNIFNATHMHFLNGLRDKAESVRQEAVSFILFLIVKRLPLNDYYLSYVFPVFTERIGSPEVVEKSEEVRLSIIECLEYIINKYSSTQCLMPFYNQTVIIICQSLKDQFPDVKISSCYTIISLEKAIPADFHLQAESFIKPVLACISHQRYRVRKAVVRALGVIVMHSTYRGVNEVVGPLGERLLDQTPQVRQAVAEVAGHWLLHNRDRYSYFGKLIPLLITGLSDEVKYNQNLCCDLWKQVGLQYERENEKELKDASEFLESVPDRYPKNIERAGLGCRALVCKHFNMMLGALANELTSWKEEVRFKCSQLLCTIVLHAESNITQHIQCLLATLFSAAVDDNKSVASNILTASKFVGLFLEYETWLKQLLPILEDEPQCRHLVVLSGILSELTLADVDNIALTITTALASNQVVFSREKKFQLALLRCIEALISKVERFPKRDINYNLFKIVTCLIALAHPENEEELSPKLYKQLLLDELDDYYNFTQTLYKELLLQQPHLWTINSQEACIFTTLLHRSRSSISIFLQNIEVMTKILKEIMKSDMDAKLKIKVCHELAAFFERDDALVISLIKMSKRRLRKNLEMLLCEVIFPLLEWHAGASAEALRSMAISCVDTIIKPIQIPNKLEVFIDEVPDEWLELWLPNVLYSLMDDASPLTREIAINCLKQLTYRANRYRINTVQRSLTVHLALIKRLDDPIDGVRKNALKALGYEIAASLREFRDLQYRAHRTHMLNVLLTHFDDKDPEICCLAEEAIRELILLDFYLVEVVKRRYIDLKNSKVQCLRMIRAIKPYIPGGELFSLKSIDNKCENTNETGKV